MNLLHTKGLLGILLRSIRERDKQELFYDCLALVQVSVELRDKCSSVLRGTTYLHDVQFALEIVQSFVEIPVGLILVMHSA